MGVSNLVTGLYLKNELMELTNFLHAGVNSGKLKVISIIFYVDVVKIGCGHIVYETIKSAEFMNL